jgi:hypothetical protein
MRKEEIEQFIGKFPILLTTVYGNLGEVLFYTGRIIKVNHTSTTIRDKYDKLVVIDNENIKKAQEL